MMEALFSSSARGGTRTYFFDLKPAANGKKYLRITESRPAGEQFKRVMIIVWPEDIAEFTAKLMLVAGQM